MPGAQPLHIRSLDSQIGAFGDIVLPLGGNIEGLGFKSY